MLDTKPHSISATGLSYCRDNRVERKERTQHIRGFVADERAISVVDTIDLPLLVNVFHRHADFSGGYTPSGWPNGISALRLESKDEPDVGKRSNSPPRRRGIQT